MCECVVMSVYIVTSKKNSLVAMFSFFTGKNCRCTQPQGKQLKEVRHRKYSLIDRVEFSLVGMGVGVCMSMNVWSEKKKQRTQRTTICTHIYTHAAHNGCTKGFKNVEDLSQHWGAQ